MWPTYGYGISPATASITVNVKLPTTLGVSVRKFNLDVSSRKFALEVKAP